MGIREMVLDRAKKKGEKERRLLGLEEGAEKATISCIKNLWATGNYTVSQIASLIKVSEAFVQNTMLQNSLLNCLSTPYTPST